MQVTTMFGQIEDRVSHQLAGAVIGDVATAFYLEKSDSTRGQGGFRCVEVSLLPGSSEGDDRRMLNEKQNIPQAIRSPKSCQPSLQH
jgi:hypothetical protein